MNMEIKIISKEIIKPFAPTPNHHKTYKLSGKDQISPSKNVPVILFYSPSNEVSSKNSDNLKKSLSKTLTLFYPFAGRIIDHSSIDCNDEGASYIEANVTGNMSAMVQQPNTHQLEQLQPCKQDDEILDERRTRILLAVQVNYFDCGGIAIGVSVFHRIADASAIASFVKCWAAISCGIDDHNVDGVVVDCTSLFPPQDFSGISSRNFKTEAFFNKEMKRFVFDGPKIAALRGKLSNGPHLHRPTRVEAVSALIWGTFVGEENEFEKVNKVAMHAVDLRKRLDPPLPQHSIGNITHVAVANWPKKVIDYNGLAGKIHDSISLLNNDYVKQVYADGGGFNHIKELAKMATDTNNWSVFAFSSWCRIPFYEVDLGWGKPIWVGTTMRADFNAAILLDTRDGDGIEAWVTLSKEELVKFEQNPDILAYASFSPSI